MKIICDIEVSNRLLPSQSMVGSRRAVKSTLGLGRLEGKSPDVFILHQTTQNKNGNKYKVCGNVEAVFTRFAAEGKATIRLRTPPHDLCIRSADPIQLNCFLRVLRNAISGQTDSKSGSSINNGKSDKLKGDNSAVNGKSNVKNRISVLSTSSKLLSSIKRTLKVTRPSEYPTNLRSLKTLEELQINGLSISRLDRQVTQLPLLRVLDLNDNCLTSLPKEISQLTHLRELRLAHNSLGEHISSTSSSRSSSSSLYSTDDRWDWIADKIVSSLLFLDLSHNKLKYVPETICRLKSLMTLKLDFNELTELPSGLGTLPNLRLLSVSSNSLHFLPGSLKKLHLEAIDISENPPLKTETVLPKFLWPETKSPASVLGIPTLVEIAARRVVQLGLHPTARDIPYNLVTYLSQVRFCICGRPCFESSLKILISMDPRSFAYSVIKSAGAQNPPTLAYLCSLSCLENTRTNPH
ncbi:hypothetical protein J437_LFUL004497 [Ladona fulva]|uniref:PIF1/LRR1 pleckstrin homology domain-containing protein n=1 Tax=Ladona fulva TaxID=123851 RepID=A0A8K0P4G2_LADFU|nr:hypothetical protein J437_LFUL004497 [Ladona fulva]